MFLETQQGLIMNLLSEVTSERETLEEQVTDLVMQTIRSVHDAIEATHSCSHVVLALVGSIPELHLPDWNNDWERDKVFENINSQLADASATIYTFPVNFTNTPAVVISIRTPAWREDIALPFTVTPTGGIVWAKPISVLGKITSPITVPSLN